MEENLITSLAERIREVAAMTATRSRHELKRDQLYHDLSNDLKLVLRSYVKCRMSELEEESDECHKVAQSLFGSYCEEQSLADCMLQFPEDFLTDFDEEFETEEDVIEAAMEIEDHAADFLTVAKWLWLSI